MNRVLLTCLFLAMPSFAAATSCNLLPYANQCQGSNLWPVPAGWAADNNGDCQPQPPDYVNAISGFTVTNGWIRTQGGGAVTGALGFGVTEAAAVTDACTRMQADGFGLGTCRLAVPEEVYLAWGSVPVACGRAPSTPLAVWRQGEDAAQSCFHWDTLTMGVSPNYAASPLHATWGCPDPSYPTLVSGPRQGCTSGWCCARESLVMKPGNGACTARWTSSAQTALQKDPLDPDCDASSCVFDGTCSLR